MVMAIWYALVLLSVAIAIWNLLRAHEIPITSTIASLVWLGLVYLLVSMPLRDEGGVGPYFINRLGAFSSHHFARIFPGKGQTSWLAIGYTLWGRDYYYRHLETADLSSVDWHAGQGSSMSGRDLNDWSVVVWYHDENRPARKFYPGARNEELLIVGPQGSRAEVTAFGQQLVKFLIESGVSLTPGSDACEFITPQRRAALKQAK